MKILLISILILFLFTSFSLFSQEIPEELKKIGFTQYTLVGYEKEGNVEFFTFSDWRTERSGDTVTFVIVDGKIKEWFKDIEKLKIDRDT